MLKLKITVFYCRRSPIRSPSDPPPHPSVLPSPAVHLRPSAMMSSDSEAVPLADIHHFPSKCGHQTPPYGGTRNFVLSQASYQHPLCKCFSCFDVVLNPDPSVASPHPESRVIDATIVTTFWVCCGKSTADTLREAGNPPVYTDADHFCKVCSSCIRIGILLATPMRNPLLGSSDTIHVLMWMRTIIRC